MDVFGIGGAAAEIGADEILYSEPNEVRDWNGSVYGFISVE